MTPERVRRCVAAPDKFRGSASAPEVARAVEAALTPLGWDVTCLPMSDGGEGLLDALGGERRSTTVTGPLGSPVKAQWSVLADARHGPLAVIEMARASGLELAGGPTRNDPLGATTAGTGELVRAALDEGVRRIVVGCGGSATSDGGEGAVRAIGGPEVLVDVDLAVVCDVLTPFLEAARVFGPQKGASPEQVDELSQRLESLAIRYRHDYGVDVTTLARAGAAGGLAGGLAAIGARLQSGFDYVAAALGLDQALDGADLVVTGEGELNATSFAGKVVGEIRARVRAPTRLLLVVGVCADDVDAATLGDAELVSLTERFGLSASLAETAELVRQVAAEYGSRGG